MSIVDSENVTKYVFDDKTVYILGTAHVSGESAKEAYELINEVRPDTVCVELDAGRIETIKNPKAWSDTDIISVIKQKKSAFMLVNIILSAYQKRLANQFGISAGQEMIESMRAAEELGAAIVPVDREIKTTFMRIWRKLGFIDKWKLIFNLVLGFVDDEEISEAELEELKSKDMLESAMSELSVSFPSLKRYLVDERDEYIAESIKKAPGSVVVAVLGAAHTVGIKKIYAENPPIDLDEISTLPPASKVGKAIGFLIPLVIIGLVVRTLFIDYQAGLSQIKSWILFNGVLSALFTALAGGHILTILTAFIAAPLTSLDPFTAAGWFAGIVEAALRKPTVKDFEALSDDLTSIKGLWKNRLCRLLLIVIFANIGSSLGTFLSGMNIFRVFIEHI